MSDITEQVASVLSYDPARLSSPVTVTDEYSKAMLVELRANRAVMAQLIAAVQSFEDTQKKMLVELHEMRVSSDKVARAVRK